MINGAIIHLINEQPIVVDLLEMPQTGDNGLLCTNVRMLDGRKPIFVERGDSVFFFPYLNVRFLEILRDREGGPGPAAADEKPVQAPPADDENLEIDEDFLRRVREA